MKAIWNGVVIAESAETRELDGYRYFPREAVRMDLLCKAEKTGSDLECPHGVQFYDLPAAGTDGERAAWSYEGNGLPQVAGWVAFWGAGVEVVG